MRATPTFAGVAILVIGVLMINFGAYTYTVHVPRIETRLIYDKTKISPIGDYASKDIYLQKNWILSFEGKVGVPDSNRSGEINLYVLNNNEYQKWKNGEKNIDYMLRLEKMEKFNETLVSSGNGTLYFLFDNRDDPKYKKEVTLTAKYAYETKVAENREERILTQAGYPLAIFGLVSLVYGLVRKPAVRWE